jgi:hypothetical protein
MANEYGQKDPIEKYLRLLGLINDLLLLFYAKNYSFSSCVLVKCIF